MLEVLERKYRESASEYAKRVLEYNIIHLKLHPGEQLQERALAEQIGVSRTPIREAILELKRRNVINIYPQHGTYVSYLENKSSENIRYLRYVFEATLVEEACKIRDDKVICLMYENVQLQKLYIFRDPDRFMALDDEFHNEIYKMCGREGLFEMIKQNSIHFDRLRLLSYNLTTSKELIDEHVKITEAIERGDSLSARAICEKHLTRAITDHGSIRDKYPQYFAPKKG